MANTITVTYKVNEDGSLSKIAKNADKAAASTGKATKAGDRYSKTQKGIAQTGLSAGKSMSKMASGMEGGLVPAYATLAAHVFAVTAAFGILSRAQSVKQLNEGLLFTGRAAGDNLTIVTRHLREITDNAVSSADAMKALAVGVSAGFSESQMEGLTKVAKGASLALGRDMTDALDRLVRGAAKLEPEILDELGIMVRLDTATQAYADTLGVSVDSLSQFERRMAFTNAIIAQGEEKFGALSAAVDSNPFNMLAATFDNLVKTAMNFVNTVAGPIAGFLAGNMTALVASIMVLGTGVVRMMVPALTAGGAAAAEMADGLASSAKAAIGNTKTFKGAPKIYDSLVKKIQSGTASQKDFDAATTSLTKSVNTHERQMKGFEKTTKGGAKAIADKKKKLLDSKAALLQLTAAQEMETLATRKATQADILNAASAGELKTVIKLLKVEIIAEQVATKASVVGKNFLYAAYLKVAAGARIAALSVKAFGLAALNAIPIIGQVIMVAMLLWEGLKWLFGSDAEETVNPLAKVLEEGKERFEEFPNIINQMATSYEGAITNSQRYILSITSMNGVIAQSVTQLAALQNAESSAQRAAIVGAQQKVKLAKKAKKDAEDRMAASAVPVSTPGDGEDFGILDKIGQVTSELGGFFTGKVGLYSQSAVTDMEVYNTALQEATDQLEVLQGLPPVGTASDALLQATTETMATLVTTLEAQRDATTKGSDEWVYFNKNIISAQGILDGLTKETLKKSVAEMQQLEMGVKKTTQSFKALKQIGIDTAAFFTKQNATFGDFKTPVDLLQKAVVAVSDTSKSETQIQAIIDSVGQFGVTGVESLNAVSAAYTVLNNKINANALLNAVETEKARGVSVYDEVAGKQILAELQRENTILAIDTLDAAVGEKDILAAKVALLKAVNTERLAENALIDARVAKDKRLGGDQFGASQAVGGYMEKNKVEFAAADDSGKFKMMGEAVSPLNEQLKKLGPEGELIASVVEGAMIMGESFSAAFDTMNDKSATTGEKMQAGLQAASSALNAIGGIMAANSRAQIKEVDNQIEAEKKRDGKSASSLAKIAKLEKKKEQMAKKAFEVNKKMQMAQAVAGTAAAVIGALGAKPWGPWNFALAGLVGAMGLAQLAVISGTSFQGAGSGAATPSGPTAITAGGRGSSVDTAKSQSASGELGYLRGDSGMGGINNFKPAFSGYKHRAGGGYVVGEQGPEVFMPETPGNIIPSGQGMGGTTNVNFSIQAVDASGVEDLLVNQRGNLIGMMREAANSYGQDFMEGVDTAVYTPSTAGATKY